MKRTWKRILKFIIESTAVILIIYGVFSAGAHIKARKDAIKQQEIAQQEAQKEENKQEEPVVENKKLSEIELNEAMENLIEQYKGNNEIGIVYKNFSTGYRYAQEDKHYFTAASTIKVIYAMKIYDRIRNGEISKDADIAYNEKLVDKEKFFEDVLKREKMENTVVGFKVAIPHGKSEFINSPQIVFAKLKKEIFWGDPDEKVKYIFLLGVPSVSAGEHIKILMKLSKKILEEKFREKLEITDEKEELLKIIIE